MLNTPMKLLFESAKLKENLPPGVKRGFVDAARRAATPEHMKQDGLCDDVLGQQQFCADREERRL